MLHHLLREAGRLPQSYKFCWTQLTGGEGVSTSFWLANRRDGWSILQLGQWSLVVLNFFKFLWCFLALKHSTCLFLVFQKLPVMPSYTILGNKVHGTMHLFLGCWFSSFLYSRSYNRPVGPQQQWYLLSCHQPVHHGGPCHLHGFTYGHPQQHHALWQLKSRPCKDLLNPLTPAWQATLNPPPPPFSGAHQSAAPPLTDLQTATKTSIPKPVPFWLWPPLFVILLCWVHLSPVLCFISVQTFVLLTAETCSCFSPSIHWDWNTNAQRNTLGYCSCCLSSSWVSTLLLHHLTQSCLPPYLKGHHYLQVFLQTGLFPQSSQDLHCNEKFIICTV